MLNSGVKIYGLFIFFSAFLIAQDTINQEEREEMIKEYQEISTKLITLQNQALSDDKISKQAEDFTKNLEEEMINSDSSVKEKINRREEIINQFEDAENKGNQMEVLKLQQEYQLITEELVVHQQQVLESNNKLKSEGEALEDSLFEKMKELDPQVPKLVARLEELGKRLQGLSKESKL